MKYALIKDGAVSNVIEADADFLSIIEPDWDHIEPLDTPHEQGLGVGIGWGYEASSNTFTDPNQTIHAPVPNRHISGLAFRRRFTKSERAAVEWAAVDKPDRPDAERQMAAALRADIKDQEQARFIDLNDPDLIGGVVSLETYGLIAVGRAAEIIDSPVQDAERS